MCTYIIIDRNGTAAGQPRGSSAAVYLFSEK